MGSSETCGHMTRRRRVMGSAGTHARELTLGTCAALTRGNTWVSRVAHIWTRRCWAVEAAEEGRRHDVCGAGKLVTPSLSPGFPLCAPLYPLYPRSTSSVLLWDLALTGIRGNRLYHPLSHLLFPSAPHPTGDVLFWDLVDGAVASRFKAHGGVVTSLAVHPEGQLLLTSSVDGAVKVWGR